MTGELLVLSIAAFALVATLVSVLERATLPWLDRLAARLEPRHRVRLWLGLAALPSVAGLLLVAASFLPALGIGHDHCIAHDPHHPHLCPHHPGAAPGMALVLVAAAAVLRLGRAALVWVRDVRACRAASDALDAVSERLGDISVFPSREPQAFVLGALRPRVHLSSAIAGFGPELLEAVVAHERVHAARRDLLWRGLGSMVAAAHLPAMAAALRVRLVTAQEMAADEEAARSMPQGRIRVAQALLQLARTSREPMPGVAVVSGDVDARVRALLDGGRPGTVWPARLLLAGSVIAPLFVGVAHAPIHHGLETLLGLLG